MNSDDIEQAFQRGRIDARYRWRLYDLLLSCREALPTSPVREVLSRLCVQQQGRDCREDPTLAEPPASATRAQQRPGMVELFRHIHQDAMVQVEDERELSRCDTLQQVQAVIRSETQSLLARSIRDIVKTMQPALDDQTLVFARDAPDFRAPPAAQPAEQHGYPVAIVPWEKFAALYGVDQVDALVALLRRCLDRMASFYTALWFETHGNQPEAARADELLHGLRGMGLFQIISNGFASGISDVVNPLHILILDVVRRFGVQAVTPELQESVIRHHVDFSAFLASFSLPCVGELEHLLRVPASAETLQILSHWTTAFTPFRGKGALLDCNYAPQFFAVRYLEDGTETGVPIIDFNFEAFTPEKLQALASRSIRLGCPSLGAPHRLFTQAASRAYLQSVLPILQRSDL